jgi:hypothetical protein
MKLGDYYTEKDLEETDAQRLSRLVAAPAFPRTIRGVNEVLKTITNPNNGNCKLL